MSWFPGPGFCSCPGFHLGLGASDCSPGLAFCSMGPWTLLGSAARSSPTTCAKTGRTAHVFTAQGCEGLIRHRPPGTPPSNPPRPPLLSGRFGIDSASIRHRFDILTLFRGRIDVESMLNRPLRRGGRGGFEGGVRGVCA